MEKTVVADPFSLINQHLVHQADLPGRTAKAQKTDLHPHRKRFPERNRLRRLHVFWMCHVPSLFIR
jgi:hypothetical protein